MKYNTFVWSCQRRMFFVCSKLVCHDQCIWAWERECFFEGFFVSALGRASGCWMHNTIEISTYKGCSLNLLNSIFIANNMFVNLFIKWAQLLSAAMVPQEDVSKWLIYNSFFISASEIQKIHQVQWNERSSELLIFQCKWRTLSKRRFVSFLNIPS